MSLTCDLRLQTLAVMALQEASHSEATLPDPPSSLLEVQAYSVAQDEAHEMLVNKDLKTTVVRPSKEYLD